MTVLFYIQSIGIQKHMQNSIIFTKNSNLGLLTISYRNREVDGAATDLTVLDILLGGNRAIHKDTDLLPTVGT
jgi:hypothetical protein